MAQEPPSAAEAPGGQWWFRLRSRQGPAALILYFDTSALIKLVLFEQGSEVALELWSGTHQAASSVLAYPEARAVLAAARRNDRLTPDQYREATRKFDRIDEALISIGVDDQLAHRAGALAADFSLRGYDAVHLATSLSLGEDGVALVTWDVDLARAALEAGLPVLGE